MNARYLCSLTPLVLLLACQAGPEAPAADAGWAVTAWGERFEVFAEVEPLVEGATAASHTHVTVLAGFSPLKEGVVTAVLRDAAGAEEAFRQDQAKRDGIFSVNLRPTRRGEYALAFRIEGPAGSEEVAAGRVRVGSRETPGGLIEPPAASPHHDGQGATGATAFLKEQQWRTEFATAWVALGALRTSVAGPGRIRPVAGGEILLTAPVDAVVLAEPWPYAGLGRARGDTVARLTPRVATDRSLSELAADEAEAGNELDLARARLDRLEELLALEAASRAEVAAARGRVASLEARREAARRDLGTARSAREGARGSAEGLDVRAPFGGRIAEVLVTPGQAVAAGASLARLVRTDPLWVDVALSPDQAALVAADPAALHLWRAGADAPDAFAAPRLVARSPEVDAQTGTVSVTLELAHPPPSLPLGSVLRAEVLLAGEREGIVVPARALVDDAGVTVAYVQVDGESFGRREVRVIARQGAAALVEGLEPGERLVTAGGAAIRRASLVSSGAGEGHVH